MSLLNPGFPGREAAPPASRLSPSASFGAESSSVGSSAVTIGLWVGAAALLGYALLRDDAPKRASARIGDYA